MANWKGTAVPNNELINNLYLNTNLTNEEMIALIDSVELKEVVIDGVSGGVYPLLYNSTFGASLIISKVEFEGVFMYVLGIMFDNGSSSGIWDSIGGWSQEGITFFEQGIGANLPIMNELDKSNYFNYYQNDKLSSLLSITPFKQVVLDLPTFLTNIANAIRTKKDITGGLWEGTTLVSNPDTMVNNIYFNTDLSVDEVAKILSKLSYIDNQNILEFPFYIAYASPDLTKCLSFVKVPIGYMIADGNFYTGQFTPLFMSYEENGMYGWIIKNKEYQIGFTGVNFVDMLQLAIGNQNDKLSTLISSTPFLEVPPKINAQDFEQEILNITGRVSLLQEKIIDTAVAVPNTGTIEKLCFNTKLTEEEVIDIINNADLPYEEISKQNGILRRYYIVNAIDFAFTIDNYSDFGASDAFLITVWVWGIIPLFASKGMLEVDSGVSVTAPGWRPELIAQGGVYNFNIPADVNYGNLEREWYCTKNDALRTLVYSDGNIIYTGEYETVKELKGDYHLENHTVTPEGTTTYNMLDFLGEKEETTKTGTLLVSNPNTLVEKIYFNTDLSASEVVKVLDTIELIDNTDIYPAPFYVAYANADLSRCVTVVVYNGHYFIGEGNFNTGSEQPLFIYPELEGLVGWVVSNSEYSIGETGISSVDTLSLNIGDQNSKLTSLISMNNDFETQTKVLKTFIKNLTVDITGYLKPEGTLEITENGTVDVSQYESATVNVPIPEPTLQEKTVTPNKNTQEVVNDSGYDGLSKVTVNPIPDYYIIPSIIATITENGVYDAKNYYEINVEVPIPEGYIQPSGTLKITENNEYDVTSYANVNVDVIPNLQEKIVTPTEETQIITYDDGYDGLSQVIVDAIPETYIEPTGTLSIIENGTYDVASYAEVDVNVPIPEGYIQPSGTLEITENNEYDVTSYASVDVNVTSKLQTKIVVPSTESQLAVTPDENYDGLSTVYVNKVTSSIDSNIQTENIKSGVTILGVEGTLVPMTASDLESKKILFNQDWFETFTIPEDIRIVPSHCFYGRYVREIVIHDKVTTLAFAAFSYSYIRKLVIPNNVTSIGEKLCDTCQQLTDVTLPNNMVTIPHSMFFWCTSLPNITIPESVTSIDGYAFYHCISLPSITIPDSVTSISNYVFYECTALNDITIPNGVTSVGPYTFSKCTSLTNIKLSNNLSSLESGLLAGCTSLVNVTVPAGVTSILSTALQIGSSTNKATITMIPTTPPSLNAYAFGYNASTYIEKIIVPAGCGDAYKSETNWSKYADIIEEASE